jgi:hypothetical protein
VPLRDTRALEEWAEREKPPYSTWQRITAWVSELDTAPWRAPSVPFPELSDLPHYEVRYAEIPATDGVTVFYRRVFDGEFVDIIDVAQVH